MATDDWLDRCAWKRHGEEFGELVTLHDEYGRPFVAMEYAPEGRAGAWERLRFHWARLMIDGVIPVLTNEAGKPLLLRYAAIDWTHCAPKLGRDREAADRVARHALELVGIFEQLAAHIEPDDRGWFTKPQILFDLEGQIRIVFAPASAADVSAEDSASWPNADERALVWVVGQAIRQQLMRDRRPKIEPLASTIARCFESRECRFHRLHGLRGELREMTRHMRVGDPDATSDRAWWQVEAGLGLLELGHREFATEHFQRAEAFDPGAPAIGRCLRLVGLTPRQKGRGHVYTARASVVFGAAPMAQQPVPLARAEPEDPIPWPEAAEMGARREAARDFDGALALYFAVRPGEVSGPELEMALARCYLELGRTGLALEHADRALARVPEHVPAHGLRTHALLRERRYAEALAAADAWVERAPDDGRAMYARGRALLGHGRMDDARAAFERATVLAPLLLEAQLLRREVERGIAHVHAIVGTQPARELDLPEHLAHVRDAFVAGSTDTVIAVLREPEHESDPVAQLVLANCLMFTRRFDDARATYERIAATWPEHRATALAGHARALVELDRAAEALALLDGAPDDANVCDARATALERLGRVDEAAAAHRLATALATRGSDLRVRGVGVPSRDRD